MNIGKLGEGANSPYVAFKDDRQRKWALVSRDIRWVLVAICFALGGSTSSQWQTLWKLVAGGQKVFLYDRRRFQGIENAFSHEI